MDQRRLIDATVRHVRDRLAEEATGHDWAHTERVRKMARLLAREEGADETVVELAALLHDIRDWKLHGDPGGSARHARQWLESLGADARIIDRVCTVIDRVSFMGEAAPDVVDDRETAVVQDADRLDALGAIGIARAFTFGGSRGRRMYDPAIPPRRGMDRETYRRHAGTTINHFHEKLLLLKDRMHTTAGRRIAHERHRFLLDYLARFQQEMNGDIPL